MGVKEEADLIEWLADLVHQQWWTWAQEVASKNDLKIETIERWKKLWVPYLNLPEEMKEEDRKWARKVLDIIKKYPQVCLAIILKSDYVLTDEEREMTKDISNVFR